MDYTIKNATNSNKGMMDKLFDVDWQIDSKWINVSSTMRPVTPARSKKGKQTKHKKSAFEADILPDYHFVPARKGGRFLIIDNQAFRMSQKQASGHMHWVCSIPSCTAWCVLTPDVKKIVRICKDHNHDMKVNRQEYRSFITALKDSVNETPHIKPKDLYDAELEKLRKKWNENTNTSTMTEEPYLPSFEAVSVAMHNSRNAVLSAVSLKATGEEVEASEVVSVQYPVPSRSTRSRVSPREKLTSSSTIFSHSPGPDLLDEEWCSVSSKDANLSDLEDWLEDDGTAMVVVSPSKPQGKSLSRKTPTKENQELKPELSNNEEDGHWDNISGLESIPRRKYRKRPASSSVFTCPHCPYKSNRHFNVQRHERLAHSTKKPEFNCKECGTSYSLEYRLKLHIKAVHQGEGHHCHVCSRTFETMTGLKSHIVTKHKNDDPKVHREPPPELTCKLCGRVFSTKSHLQKHTSTHVMIQPYRCCICNKPFMEEVTWLSHQSSCSDAFTVQCCLCSAFVPTAEDLMSHMDVVHGRSEYSCYCGKSFPWKKSLLTHQQKCSLFLAERSM